MQVAFEEQSRIFVKKLKIYYQKCTNIWGSPYNDSEFCKKISMTVLLIYSKPKIYFLKDFSIKLFF